MLDKELKYELKNLGRAIIELLFNVIRLIGTIGFVVFLIKKILLNL